MHAYGAAGMGAIDEQQPRDHRTRFRRIERSMRDEQIRARTFLQKRRRLMRRKVLESATVSVATQLGFAPSVPVQANYLARLREGQNRDRMLMDGLSELRH